MSLNMLRAALLALALVTPQAATALPRRFEIMIAPSASTQPVTGRLVLIVAKRDQPEPRLTVGPSGPALFAIDLNQLRAGQSVILDERALGYPYPLRDLPDSTYFVQAVVNVYHEVRRPNAPVVWLPINDGRQETFNVAAGNFYSDVQRVNAGDTTTVRITIGKIIAQAPEPTETPWVKRVKIQSAKLTAFWGRPMFVRATVLLPQGYAERPNVKYPVVFTFGHNVPFSFSTDSARARNIGQINPVTGLETGFDFYRSWTRADFPRFIAVSFEQQTPFFPDSYSTNSVNQGPYEDALLQEVIPALERQFRMIAKPYARLVEGASTGGWQSLALQLRNAEFFGGAFVLQPDPIDFRRYQLVNIYEDENAFRIPAGPFGFAERPFRRTVEGQVVWTLRQMSLFEEVLGTRGRSGYQLEGWEAIYGPMGADGYPKPLWDKLTGKIDHDVANYMRQNGYDLREYAQRNWSTIGPNLAGKLHFFTGDMDDFYLNLAVYRMEEFLKSTTNPKSDATFTYGRPMKGHSWHDWTWADLVRRMATHVTKNAPAGEDTRAWKY